MVVFTQAPVSRAEDIQEQRYCYKVVYWLDDARTIEGQNRAKKQ